MPVLTRWCSGVQVCRYLMFDVQATGSALVRVSSTALFLALCAGRNVLAQDAAAIIKKTTAVYANARTYQVTFQVDTDMGAMGTVSQIVEVKMIPYKKTSIITRLNGKGRGQIAMVPRASTVAIDDGKTMITYMHSTNSYMKRPHTPGTNFNGLTMLAPQLNTAKPDRFVYKLLPSEMLNGSAAYIIQVENAAGQQRASVNVYIDRATYHIRQVKYDIQMASPKGTTGSPSRSMLMTMSIRSEKFDQPIPQSVFTFTPPPGATEMAGALKPMGSAVPQGQ